MSLNGLPYHQYILHLSFSGQEHHQLSQRQMIGTNRRGEIVKDKAIVNLPHS
jgi:hypothetical protein